MDDLTLQVRRSLKESLPNRQVIVRSFTEKYIGETRAYRGRGKAQVYHTDKDCPHFPDGAVYIRPISDAKNSIVYDMCDYCARVDG